MKKNLALILLLGMITCVNAQNIIQISNNGTNNKNNTEKDCDFKINGICSSEDIGGVSAEVDGRGIIMELTNYNQFPVTVLYKVECTRGDRDGESRTGSVVLGAAGSDKDEKKIDLRDGTISLWKLEGIIVRKLKK